MKIEGTTIEPHYSYTKTNRDGNYLYPALIRALSLFHVIYQLEATIEDFPRDKKELQAHLAVLENTAKSAHHIKEQFRDFVTLPHEDSPLPQPPVISDMLQSYLDDDVRARNIMEVNQITHVNHGWELSEESLETLSDMHGCFAEYFHRIYNNINELRQMLEDAQEGCLVFTDNGSDNDMCDDDYDDWEDDEEDY